MSDLKPGDIVHLNSGGPAMTLEALSSSQHVIARYTWFDGPQKHSENFVITALRAYKPAQAVVRLAPPKRAAS